MNNVNIMGRIATDLVLKPVRSPAGVVLNFKIAVERYTPNGRVADFIRCNAWGKTAERICKYFTKGTMIAVNGSLTTDEYIDRNNIRRFTTDVFVKDFYFTGDRYRRAEDQNRTTLPLADYDFSDFEEV